MNLYKGTRTNEAVIINRLQDRISSQFDGKLRRELARTWRDYARGDIAIIEHRERLKPILESLLLKASRTFGNRLFDQLATINTKQEVPSPVMFESLLVAWIAEYSSTLISYITETTKSQIAAAIASAREQGFGLSETAAFIQSVAAQINPVRASIIARTETHGAANKASHLAAKTANTEMVKEWVSVTDLRTRSSHVAADGQQKRLDEPFMVGGYRLMMPGDQSAGAPSETIMCRCAVVYEVIGFD